MKVKTFLGKVGMEALEHMDDQVNRWLDRKGATVKKVTQAFGYEQMRETGRAEPVIITSVWYEERNDDNATRLGA